MLLILSWYREADSPFWHLCLSSFNSGTLTLLDEAKHHLEVMLSTASIIVLCDGSGCRQNGALFYELKRITCQIKAHVGALEFR
jgi:hypothetical protein